jgi:thioredoxin 1
MGVLELGSAADLDELLRSYPSVVVDFSAGWCGPCRTYGPVFAAVAQSTADAAFVKVDVDLHPELAHRFKVLSVPTTLVLNPDGTVRSRGVGALPERELRSLVG